MILFRMSKTGGGDWSRSHARLMLGVDSMPTSGMIIKVGFHADKGNEGAMRR